MRGSIQRPEIGKLLEPLEQRFGPGLGEGVSAHRSEALLVAHEILQRAVAQDQFFRFHPTTATGRS